MSTQTQDLITSGQPDIADVPFDDETAIVGGTGTRVCAFNSSI